MKNNEPLANKNLLNIADELYEARMAIGAMAFMLRNLNDSPGEDELEGCGLMLESIYKKIYLIETEAKLI